MGTRKHLISFIPLRRVTISTDLTLDQMVRLFSDSISREWDTISETPPRNIREAQGWVNENGFSIRPTSYYQGSFTYLEGRFIPGPEGVSVEMYVFGILYLILPTIIFFALCVLIYAIIQNNPGTIIGSSGVILGSVIGLFVEADQLDWFISNLLEKHIVE